MGLQVNNCCFCIELKTGCFIIGYLSLIASAILSLLSILGVVGSSYVISHAAELNPDEQEKLRSGGTVVLVVSIIALIMTILNLIFVILLLVGIHKDKREYVKAYLIYNTIYIVLKCITFIVRIVGGGCNAGDIVLDLLTILLSIYFLIVLRSYYLKMGDTSKRPAVYNTA